MKKPVLSPEELGVARRLREARNHLNLSQGDVARQLGITRERLASYEDGRTPIRFDIALRFCWHFVFSEEWLALGEKEIIARMDKQAPGSRHVWIPTWARWCMSLLVDPVFHKIKPGTLFVEAYKNDLATVYHSIRKDKFGPHLPLGSVGNDDHLRNYFHALMEIWMSFFKTPFEKFRLLSSTDAAAHKAYIQISGNWITDEERDTILMEARDSGKLRDDLDPWRTEVMDFLKKNKEDFLARLSSGFAASLVEREKKQVAVVSDLTEAETPARLANDVKKQLPSLLERLNKATKETGKMSALADYLKVPLASVSRWLSGKREPGGENTLAMLNWVEREERK